MRVFVTGATGFIGTALVRELVGAGHTVVGLARSDASAQTLIDAGVEVHRGSLTDLESLRRGAEAADGVIHTAFVHDFSEYAKAGETDLHAVRAIGEALAGSGRPFVSTSGTALLTPGRVGTEEDAADPQSGGAPRVPSEEYVLSLAEHGVRSSVVRLSPSVHGDEDRGFVPMLIQTARESGVSAYVGEGLNRWSAVHRLDAVRLYRLALESGTAGARYHGVADEGIPVRRIAETIGRRLGVPVASRTPEEVATFGWLGAFITLDSPASSALTQERLGWRPTHPGLLEDLEGPAYFGA
jgi:nucleoside-diphosphate-sugar epimerase